MTDEFWTTVGEDVVKEREGSGLTVSWRGLLTTPYGEESLTVTIRFVAPAEVGTQPTDAPVGARQPAGSPE